jgi:hypothetical protein
MTSMRTVAVIIFVAMAAFFVACFYAGIFDEVGMSVSEQGPYCLVYREHTGPYRDVRFVRIDVCTYLRDRGAAVPARSFVRLLDNPQKVKPENQRSIAGYVTDSLLPNVQPPYKTDIFPRTRAVSAVFPVRSFLSQITGPLKFYPRLFRYCGREKLETNGPVFELYDSAAKKIEYVAPVK